MQFIGRVRPIVVAIFIALPTLVQAELRAILVGVSDYDAASGFDDLKGPANDVRLMRDVLTRRGAARITVLADGVDGGATPTRKAVLAALAAERDRAQPGDFLYLHLSGHGSQQQDQNGDETDGLDEVFLTADARAAAPGASVFSGVLVDDEIGQAVDAIRARGTNVWLVMDSCHSGSGLRAAIHGSRARFVDPASAGVNVTPRPAAQQVAVDQ